MEATKNLCALAAASPPSFSQLAGATIVDDRPLLSPLRSGPKAASKPARQKKIFNSRFKSPILARKVSWMFVILLLLLVAVPSQSARAAVLRTAWELNGDLDAEIGSAGPLQAVGWTPSYIAYDGGVGNDAIVFPEFSSSQWLFADTADTTANPSGASFVNNYTIMMDVKFDNTSQWIGLYQTNNNNLNNAELYIKSDGSGIGVNGDYGSSPQFSFLNDSWHRITIVADLDIDQALEVYVDGNLENTIPVLSQDGRWSFNDQSNARGLLFFSDDNGASETASGALNSLAIWDSALDASEVAAFGGPSAEGISAIPEPSTCTLLAVVITVACARGRRSRC